MYCKLKIQRSTATVPPSASRFIFPLKNFKLNFLVVKTSFQIFSSLTQYALDIILIPSLQDVEDMVDMKNPEWMSVMTYISLIYNHFNGIRVGGPKLPPMPDQE